MGDPRPSLAQARELVDTIDRLRREKADLQIQNGLLRKLVDMYEKKSPRTKGKVKRIR